LSLELWTLSLGLWTLSLELWTLSLKLCPLTFSHPIETKPNPNHQMKNTVIAILLIAVFVLSCKTSTKTDFVTVKDTGFKIGDKDYHFLGTNFWYGLNLGSKGAGGDRERLKRELDRLKAMGVNNLRIVAGSEGPDNEPYRMVPALQTSPGVYNEEVLDGLDFLLNEMKSREMYAVMCMGNFWNWSGGFGQYLVWSGAADSIPYPPPNPGGDWDKYQKFTSGFYLDQKAMDMFNDHLTFIVNRKNPYSGLNYKDDPTIMSWQLANEPRGINNVEAYKKWIENTTTLIKKLDGNHLVTIGSEGNTSSAEYSGTAPEEVHQYKTVDYMTMHLWVQNWGVYDPFKADSTFESSLSYAQNYIDVHEEMARKLNKPLVMEEFGISRDSNRHDAGSSTVIRDKYYAKIFEMIYVKSNIEKSVIAGCNYWAWAGEGRPRVPEGIWQAGDNFIGDPPHEAQGWYSVFDTDTTTVAIIKTYADKMNVIKQAEK
jgi:mannan endo-1,4-beta-mannosidase